MEIDITDIKPVSSCDERINYIIEQSQIGVELFARSIRESSEDIIEISFHAFTLETENNQEAGAVFEVIMTSLAIQLKEFAPDLVEIYTFYNSQEETAEGHKVLLLHCRKEKPPVPEAKVVELEEEKPDITLPHPSLISAYQKPGSGE